MEEREYSYRPARAVHIDYTGEGSIEAEIEVEGSRREPLVSVPLNMVFDFIWNHEDNRIYPWTPRREFTSDDELIEPAKIGLEIVIVYMRDVRWPPNLGYYPIGWGHRSAFEQAEGWLKMDPEERAERLAISG